MAAVSDSSEPCGQVARLISRLRTYEDHNLAIRLQEEEFSRHYEMNRDRRRQVLSDRKHSQNEQEWEDQFRRHLNLQIAEGDEGVARRLQEEFEREDELRKQSQTRQDEEIARRLQENVEHESALQRDAQTRADEHLARRLQMDESDHYSGGSAPIIHNQLIAARQNRDARAAVDDDERLARELQKKFDEEERTVQKIHRDEHKISFKSLIPLTDKWSQHRNSWKSRAHEHSVIRRWQNSVDANTQNEVNSQMASANRSSAHRDGPPPYSVAIQDEDGSSTGGQPTASHRPLAVIASRESRNEPNDRLETQNQDLRGVSFSSSGVRALPVLLDPSGIVTSVTHSRRERMNQGSTIHGAEAGTVIGVISSEPDLITFDDISPPVVASHP